MGRASCGLLANEVPAISEMYSILRKMDTSPPPLASTGNQFCHTGITDSCEMGTSSTATTPRGSRGPNEPSRSVHRKLSPTSALAPNTNDSSHCRLPTLRLAEEYFWALHNPVQYSSECPKAEAGNPRTRIP